MVVVGWLVIMAEMEDELTGMVVTTVCILKMQNWMTLIEEGFDDNENPFANDGLFEWRREHCQHADHEGRKHHHGHHNRDD